MFSFKIKTETVLRELTRIGAKRSRAARLLRVLCASVVNQEAINLHQTYSKLIKPNQGFFRKKDCLFLQSGAFGEHRPTLSGVSFGPKFGPQYDTLL